MRPASLPRLARFLLTLCLIAATAPALAQKCCKPELHQESGLHVASFQTPDGTIRVFLPGDMAAGDTISGTVVGSPSAQAPGEAAGELSGYVVEIEGNKPGQDGRARFVLPAGAGQAMLLLRDKAGQEVSRQAVPLLTAAQAGAGTLCPQHDLFMLPVMGQAGQPLHICGPFDGDLANTALRVGGQPARALAESPRQAIFQAPAGASGKLPLELSENGRQFQGEIQMVRVTLSAPKTTLRRGESTTLTVTVSGLQGLARPLPLELVNRSTNVVTLEGGNSQTVPISPQVNMDQLTITRTVTGLQPGGFDIHAQLKIEATPAPGSSAPAGGSKPAVSATGPGESSAPLPGSETPVGKVETPGDTSGFCAMGSVGKPTGKPSPTPERPLLCRGTLEMLLVDRPSGDPGAMGDTYLWGTFVPNPTEAGDSGQKLAAGTCAWVDAGIAPGQPNQFLYEFSSTVPKLVHRASLIEHCSSDSQCVFEVCASFYAYYPPVWLIDADKIRVVFPKF